MTPLHVALSSAGQRNGAALLISLPRPEACDRRLLTDYKPVNATKMRTLQEDLPVKVKFLAHCGVCKKILGFRLGEFPDHLKLSPTPTDLPSRSSSGSLWRSCVEGHGNRTLWPACVGWEW